MKKILQQQPLAKYSDMSLILVGNNGKTYNYNSTSRLILSGEELLEKMCIRDRLFDESINLTDGGPANASISMSHYIYNLCFKYVPNFGYAAAMSFFILLLVAVLAFIQMRVGDKRD